VRQARLFRADAKSIGGWPGAAAFETRQAAMLPEAEKAGCGEAKFTERRLGAPFGKPLNNWGRRLSELSFARRSPTRAAATPLVLLLHNFYRPA
jgi:hypothetical protein